MANTSISMPSGRSHPNIRRSTTLPTNLITSRSSLPGTQPGTPDEAETLFTYHTSKIVSFSPPLTGSLLTEPKHRRDSLDEEPVGILPWGSRAERTLSTGSLRLYKVPGSTAFISSGRTVHAIMSKSRCWCVDGNSKFVLRIRGNSYYRIELPNATTEDQDAVVEFKVVLSRILQYETTPCPFDRDFYIELPEKPDVILKPWKPKHSPITSRQGDDEPQLREDSPGPEPENAIHVAKRTEDRSQSSLKPEDSTQDSDGKSMAAPEHVSDREPPRAYVEGVVTNYETMKSRQMQMSQDLQHTASTQRYKSVLLEDKDEPITSQPILISPTAISTIEVPKESSASPGAEVDDSTSGDCAISSQSDNNEASPDQQPSPPHEDTSTSKANAVQNRSSEVENIDIHREEDLEPTKTARHTIGRSFTAPVPYNHPTLSSASISSTEQHDEAAAEDVASSASSARSARFEKDSPQLSGAEEDEDSGSRISEPEPDEAGPTAKEEIDTGKAGSDKSLSEAGSSTPEWLDISPPSSPQILPELKLGEEDERLSSATHLEIEDGKASPASQLRRRFRQRRQLSPMPSMTVLHVPSHEHPGLDIAIDLLRSVCRTLLVLSAQILLLLMNLISRSLRPKTIEVRRSRPESSKSSGNISDVCETDSSEDDFVSIVSDVTSEEDLGLPVSNRTVEKRRASSDVKRRKKGTRSRKSSAQSAT